MSGLATDPEAPARETRRGSLGAALWALAVGTCTGAAWALAVVFVSLVLDVNFRFRNSESLHLVLFGCALGAVDGALTGFVLGLVRGNIGARAFCGALFGALGGGACVLAVVATDAHLHPLLSSALAWVAVGALAGLCGHNFAPQSRDEPFGSADPETGLLLWASVGAACAAGTWLLGFGFGCWLLRVSSLDIVRLGTEAILWQVIAALVMALGGAVSGFLVGGVVGLTRRSRWPALAVVVIAVLGALGGGLCVPVMIACAPRLNPLAGSALLWALVGALAGATGYAFRPRPIRPDSLDEDEEEPAVPAPRIEWLLRETKRRLLKRVLTPALVRVLPVLTVSAGAFVGAALVAPSDVWLALAAVGALGAAVALVLYRQEQRLSALERRFTGRRET